MVTMFPPLLHTYQIPPLSHDLTSKAALYLLYSMVISLSVIMESGRTQDPQQDSTAR